MGILKRPKILPELPPDAMGRTDTRMVQSDTRVPKSPIEWDEVGLAGTEGAAVSALLNRHARDLFQAEFRIR